MFQINYYSYKFYSFLLLILGFFSIFQEVDTENNIFFLLILIFQYFKIILNINLNQFTAD